MKEKRFIPNEIKEILLIRSARMEQVNRVLHDLKMKSPQASITVLAQAQVENELRKDSQVEEIILYNERKFNIWNGLKYLSKIRKKRFDLAVILYNTPSGVGCLNVELFALLIRAKYRMVYELDGHSFVLPWYFCPLKFIRAIKKVIDLFIFLFIAFNIKSRKEFPKGIKRKKKMVCIGIDGRVLGYYKGGVPEYIYNLVENLGLMKENGFKYIIFQGGQRNSFSANSNIRQQTIRIPSFHFQEQIFWPVELSKQGIDLFHGTACITPLIRPCKSIITIHDLAWVRFPQYLPDPFLSGLKKWIPISIKGADLIIAVSRKTKEDIIEFFGVPENKIKVVYEGVNKRVYRPIEDTRSMEKIRQKYHIFDPFILNVGALQPRKNIQGIIKAYYKLKNDNYLDYKLVIPGRKGWLYNEIFQLVRDLELEKDVIFTGAVENEELSYLYNAAELFVFPSFYEGFGLPVLEAMACGTPVITSNTSSLTEVAGEAAILVDPHNVEELAEAMHRVLTDTALKDQMREKGLEQVSKFSWEKCARETLEVYQEALGRI
ncbi:MAG: glycosyltransferase [bacterium]